MTWTQPDELPLIKAIGEAIVADASGGMVHFDGRYKGLAPTLFGDTPFTVSAKAAPFNELRAISAGSGNLGILITVGVLPRPRASTTDTVVTVSGVLCHELVHKKQRARDGATFDEASDTQTSWQASKKDPTLPREWMNEYYSNPYEVEAHAEGIAFEIWIRDTIAGVLPRKEVSLDTITDSEPLRRIRERLMPPELGTPLVGISNWFELLEATVNGALVSWSVS